MEPSTRPLDVTPTAPTVWTHGTQLPSKQDHWCHPYSTNCIKPSHPLDKTSWCYPCSTHALFELMGPSHRLDKTPWCHLSSCMNSWNPVTLWTRPLYVTSAVAWTHGTQSPSGQDPLMSPLQYPLYEFMGPSHPLDKTPWCYLCRIHGTQSPSGQDPLMLSLQYPCTVWTHGTQSPSGQDPMECINKVWWIAIGKSLTLTQYLIID